MSSKRRSRKSVTVIGALITATATICAAFIALWPDKCKILPCGSTDLAVRVTNSINEPVSGATSLLFSNEGALKQYTDSNGSALFSDASKLKDVRLVVEAPGYDIYEQQISGRADKKIDVMLKEKQGSKAGVIFRAFDQNSGMPVDRADLQVFVGADLFTQATDSNGVGKFELTFPPSGKLDVMLVIRTKDFEIKNEHVTLYPNQVQDIMLNVEKTSFEINPVLVSSQSTSTSVPETQSDEPELTSKGVLINALASSRVNPNTGFEITVEPAPSENQTGELRVLMASPNNEPLSGINTVVYTQKTDVNNQPLQDQYITQAGTDIGGTVTIQLQPNTYGIFPDIAGYLWNDLIYNHTIQTNERTSILIVPSQVAVIVHRADKSLFKNNYVAISTQKLDANGNSIPDQRVREGRIDDTGVMLFTLTPGRYTIYIDGLLGEDWGEVDHDLPPATRITYDIWLGRIRVEARDADGKVLQGFYSNVCFEKLDANGEPIPGDGIQDGRTDDTGVTNYDLTPGYYFIVSDLGRVRVKLDAGKTVVVKNEDFKQP